MIQLETVVRETPKVRVRPRKLLRGRISITSPLARALIGKSKGAQVEVNTPGGAKAYEVKKVEWR